MTKGKRIGYVRVSTVDQNPERQLEGIELDKRFIDYASGGTINRPQLDALLGYVRDDDTVMVHSLDRLARNVKDLRKVVDQLLAKKVSVHFVKEGIIFNGDQSPMSDLLLSIIGAIAEFEHAIILERLREGIAIAKKAGKYKGRQSRLNKEMVEKIKIEMQTRKNKSKIARDLNISRSSLYEYLRRMQQQQICLT